MASTYLSRSISSNGNPKIWTFSAWVKKQYIGTTYLLSANDGSTYSTLSFAGDQLRYYDYWSGSIQAELKTNAKYRDVNGWYHIVVRYKTTESTASDRIKFYVNGVQVTSFATSSYPANTNWDSYFNSSSQTNYINYESGGTMQDVTMSHVHFCDGYAYDASAFGSTDATTGEWKINTSPSVSYGTNGYFILKDGNSVTDQSPNTNNWTISGTLSQTEDNPSNIFATLNPLFYSADVTLSNGNTTVAETGDNWRSAYSTLGVSTGKWYWEAEISYQSGNEAYFGLAHEDHMNGHDVTYGGNVSGSSAPNSGGYDYIGYSTRSFGIYSNGNQDYPSTTTYTGAYNASTYKMSFALDIPNRKLYVARNGVWTNGSNNDWGSSTFDSTVGALDISGKIPATGFIFPAFSPNQSTWKVNFGNGRFGTSNISSPQQDGAGQGKFQYTPPSGYYAICTKNINAYG